MPANLVVPQLGESVVEATVGKWHKKTGDFLQIGDVVVELETDKIDLEVGATHSGILLRIEHQEGDTVKIGDVLGIIEETEAAPVTAAEEHGAGVPQPQETPGAAVAPEEPPVTTLPEIRPDLRATPSARRLAREKGVDLSLVAGTQGAPLTMADVQKRIGTSPPPSGLPQTTAPEVVKPWSGFPENGREERVRLSRRRLTIAARLVEALRTAAMVTTFNDVDMRAVMEIRRRRQESFKQRYGINLGIVSFFVKAVIPALRAFPRLNAEIQGDEMVLKHYYDIGIAVGAPDGLVVPVLRDADRMTFGSIEQAIKDYARKARERTLTLEDLRGGTFTISNGGVFGSLLSTPILNPPQVAILGLHRIEDRPVNVGGAIQVRPMMYMALSYDHRIVDGLEAVHFLKRVKELVEDPESLFFES